jgi:ABC-type sugar transport system, ATPase component
MFDEEPESTLERGAPVLELRHVAKSFGAVQALRDGQLVLRSRAIHALMGENGAGKSTLVKTIAGLHQPDAGELILDSSAVVFGSTAAAKEAGIAVVYQEPTLLPI